MCVHMCTFVIANMCMYSYIYIYKHMCMWVLCAYICWCTCMCIDAESLKWGRAEWGVEVV